MVSDEQLREAYRAAVEAHNRSRLAAQQYNLLLAQAMLERGVPPGHTIDPADGQVKPAKG